MIKLLVIDDDKDVRWDIVTDWWLRTKGIGSNELVWLTRYPVESLVEYLKEHPDIKYLSLDHDLGHTDMTVELNKEMWTNPNEYERQFKNRDVIIHSMNAVGQQNILQKLKPVAKSAKIVSLNEMI